MAFVISVPLPIPFPIPIPLPAFQCRDLQKLYFIKYRLDQLNNKRMKTVVNLTIKFFESRYQKKCLVTVWSFLTQPPQNDGNLNFLWNWTKVIFEWLLFSNFTNIRYLIYWKCIIWAKFDFPIINSVCEKVWFKINGLWKMLFFKFSPFSFFQISNDYCQKYYREIILFDDGFLGF